MGLFKHDKKEADEIRAMQTQLDNTWETNKQNMNWVIDKMIRLERELHEVREENAGLLMRLEALERAHWHEGIEQNCTECREVWNK